MTIRDSETNKLQGKIQQLTKELKDLNKKGKEREIKQKQAELQELEKQYNQLVEKRRKGYPSCGWCGQKVLGSCLRVAGAPRNYHPECLEIKKEKDQNPFLFAKVEQLEKELANANQRITEMRSKG